MGNVTLHGTQSDHLALRFMKILRLAVMAAGILGLVLCLAMGTTAVYLFRTHSWKPGTYVRVTGYVIRMDQERVRGRYGSDVVYYPIVQYQAGENGSYTVRAMVGSSPPKYKIGDPVKVKYKKKNPAKAMLDTALEQSFLPGLFLGLSILGFMFAIICVLVGWRLPKIIEWLRLKNGIGPLSDQ